MVPYSLHLNALHFFAVEIRPSSVGLIQLTDNFDPIPQTTSHTAYDFHFLSLFYCDLQRASVHRTMHQIDGKRYPLELEFIFLRKAPSQLKFSVEGLMDENNDFANDPPDSISTLYDSEYLAVIVSVLGEVCFICLCNNNTTLVSLLTWLIDIDWTRR